MKNLSDLPQNFISWNDSVDRVGGEEDFLIELLNDLKDLVQQNLEKIKKYINENNYTEIREIAHSMKGASGNLGLNTLYDTTLNLEQQAKEQNLESINKYYFDLENEYKYLELLLKN